MPVEQLYDSEAGATASPCSRPLDASSSDYSGINHIRILESQSQGYVLQSVISTGSPYSSPLRIFDQSPASQSFRARWCVIPHKSFKVSTAVYPQDKEITARAAVQWRTKRKQRVCRLRMRLTTCRRRCCRTPFSCSCNYDSNRDSSPYD